MKKSELRQIIREEVQKLNELSKINWKEVHDICDNVIKNWKKITKYDIMDMLDKDGNLDQYMWDKSLLGVKEYVLKNYDVDIVYDYNGEILNYLDDEIINYIG